MKAKSIFAATLLVSGLAFGDTASVDTEFVLGVLPYHLDAGQTEALISIPWIEPGTNDVVGAGVAVTNLVKTAGLTKGDLLLWYDGTGYKSWSIASNEATSVMYWEPRAVTSKFGKTITASDFADLQRGRALLLQRMNENPAATDIYIVGQYTSNAAQTIDLGEGSSSDPVRTLIAPPRGVAVNLNDNTVVEWSNVGPNDIIYIRAAEGGLMKAYYRNSENTAWGCYKMVGITEEWDDTVTPTIAAGEGAWYFSRGGSGSTTLTWK